MFIYCIEKNNIYIIFNDLINDLFSEIDKTTLNSSLKNEIKNFIQKNKINNNLYRQKNYVNSIYTYIDNINGTYNLFIYILPKEIDFINVEKTKDNIKKIEKIVKEIFKIYLTLTNSSKIKFTILKEFKGDNLLDLELQFYIDKLNQIYNYLINYKKNHKNIIICSDKIVGIKIDFLNVLEENPLKIYQMIKKNSQKDLIIFIYSLISYFEKNKIKIFKNSKEFFKLIKIIEKIKNFLIKISDVPIFSKNLTQDNLTTFFNEYKNKKEIKQNRKIFILMKELFLNQLKEGVFFYEKIDLTKMFEKFVERGLKNFYKENLYIGNEEKGKIIGKNSEYLNMINYLLERKNKKKLKQYPDFLIKENDIYHIIDAKYRLLNSLLKDRTIFWQIIIYSKLFNKNKDLSKVKKIIIYPKKLEIDLKKVDLNLINIKLNQPSICIENNIKLSFNELVFNTTINFIEVELFKCKFKKSFLL